MDWDPLNLKSFGPEAYKKLMALLLTCISTLTLAIIVFIVASTSRDEVTENYLTSFEQEGQNNYFESISFKTKVMPSQGHGVQDLMVWSNKELPYNKELLKKNFDDDDYTPSYYLYNEDTSLKFATFIFNDEMVPVGNAQEKCVYFEYAPASDKKNSKAYTVLKDLPECKNAKQGLWSQNDPILGVGVPTWTQNLVDLSCSGKNCEKNCEKKAGWWVWDNEKTGGHCYSYNVLTEICITVQREVDIYDKVHYRYNGGCYQDGQVGKYTQGKPGSTYKFESIPILVRSMYDPYLSVSQSHSATKSNSSHLLNIVALLLFIIALGTGAGFGYEYKKANSSGLGYREHA